MRRAGALAVLLALLAGCEALVGISDKVATDAGTTPNDGNSGSSSGGSGEASAADGGLDPDVPCGQQPGPEPLFCDDFDSEGPISGPWTWDTPTKGATIALDTTEYRSAPNSAQFVVPTTAASAQLGYDVGTLTSGGFSLAFDLRVDVASLAPLPQVGIAQAIGIGSGVTFIYVLGPGAQASIQVYVGSGEDPTATLPLATLPAPQTWTRIVLVYDPVQGLTVLEDGQTITTSTQYAMGAPGHAQFILGDVFETGSGTAFQAEMDNIVIRSTQ
jgi:hypothetical protein